MVSEHGLADLRARCPRERAQLIIEKCAHPMYRDALRDYVRDAEKHTFGHHTPHNLEKALSWHSRLQKTGSMNPNEPETSKTKRTDVNKAAKKLDQTAAKN